MKEIKIRIIIKWLPSNSYQYLKTQAKNDCHNSYKIRAKCSGSIDARSKTKSLSNHLIDLLPLKLNQLAIEALHKHSLRHKNYLLITVEIAICNQLINKVIMATLLLSQHYHGRKHKSKQVLIQLHLLVHKLQGRNDWT